MLYSLSMMVCWSGYRVDFQFFQYHNLVETWLRVEISDILVENREMRVATILYEILCYGGIVLLPFSYQMAGWIGLILHTVLVNGSSIVLDFLVSPTASENGEIVDSRVVESTYLNSSIALDASFFSHLLRILHSSSCF